MDALAEHRWGASLEAARSAEEAVVRRAEEETRRAELVAADVVAEESGAVKKAAEEACAWAETHEAAGKAEAAVKARADLEVTRLRKVLAARDLYAARTKEAPRYSSRIADAQTQTSPRCDDAQLRSDQAGRESVSVTLPRPGIQAEIVALEERLRLHQAELQQAAAVVAAKASEVAAAEESQQMESRAARAADRRALEAERRADESAAEVTALARVQAKAEEDERQRAEKARDVFSTVNNLPQQLEDMFTKLDKNGDGRVSRIEMITACRRDPDVAAFFGLKQTIRQEDGRDAFERIFQTLDVDNDRAVTLAELRAWPAAAAEVVHGDSFHSALMLLDAAPHLAEQRAEQSAAANRVSMVESELQQERRISKAKDAQLQALQAELATENRASLERAAEPFESSKTEPRASNASARPSQEQRRSILPTLDELRSRLSDQKPLQDESASSRSSSASAPQVKPPKEETQAPPPATRPRMSAGPKATPRSSITPRASAAKAVQRPSYTQRASFAARGSSGSEPKAGTFQRISKLRAEIATSQADFKAAGSPAD